MNEWVWKKQVDDIFLHNLYVHKNDNGWSMNEWMNADGNCLKNIDLIVAASYKLTQ